MYMLENGRLNREIERLRKILNRQKDYTSSEAMRLSVELDKLIVQVMKDERP